MGSDLQELGDAAEAARAVETPGGHDHDHAREARLAVANAIKLGLSILSTVGIAIIVRVFIPRFLGPEGFGRLSFAEAYAATFFTFATFGVDTYIRKEIAARPEHANDFYAGFFLLRLAASALIFGLMAAGLMLMGKPSLEWRLAFIFAVGQVAYIDNFTLSAFLQSISQINELAWMNVASKIVWCALTFGGLLNGAPIEWLAVAFGVSETLKTVYLMRVAHRRLHLKWHVNMQATFAVVAASFPFFLNSIALSIYSRLNVIMLSHFSSDTEVGWYNSANNLASFSLLFLPVLQAVLMPMASRVARKSEEAMNEVMRGGARLMIVGGTLISLVLMLNADVVALRVFGEKYAPAAPSLQVLALMFPLTYVATVASMHLIQQDRKWTLIKVSVLNMCLLPLISAPLMLWGAKMGPGMAGAMGAAATVVTEGVTVVINLWLLGKAAVDSRFWHVVTRTLVASATVVGLHTLIAPLGIWRIPIEIAAYVGLALALRILPVADVLRMIEDARRARAARGGA